MYYRNRYYVPGAGRFTQPDPAGFADGPNLFGYVGNNPMSFIDPMGLSSSASTTALMSQLTSYYPQDPWSRSGGQIPPWWWFLDEHDGPGSPYITPQEREDNANQAIGFIRSNIPGIELNDAIRNGDGFLAVAGSVLSIFPPLKQVGRVIPDIDIKYISWTTDKKISTHGVPNSLNIYTDADGTVAVKTGVYDCDGLLCAQVDFKPHNTGGAHGHILSQPGNVTSLNQSHGIGADHVEESSLPSSWFQIPSWLQRAK